MNRATAISRSFAQAADTITLDETARHRRRMAMRSDNGIEFLLDLSEARLLCDGDGLVLDDGRIIAVRAAPEPLYEVRGRDRRHLLALAWQLGNRHLPAEICEERILIRRDHVIRDMLIGLGATVMEISAPFSPEGGAYHSHAHGSHHHHHD
ncbi:urease accessory protein UreE [Chelativorans intermedius]|uniref:Urease accessory protein UreE n=1 Tax=Chelativorans intermedius TaxID=515947 RepID=A0ABV6D650_9HYPH|nr:urease accessory protein UreE [Chelativorans intermedius]MCT8999374.1 urease accessory protein UreE [Chelativorans intermedius]